MKWATVRLIKGRHQPHGACGHNYAAHEILALRTGTDIAAKQWNAISGICCLVLDMQHLACS